MSGYFRASIIVHPKTCKRIKGRPWREKKNCTLDKRRRLPGKRRSGPNFFICPCEGLTVIFIEIILCRGIFWPFRLSYRYNRTVLHDSIDWSASIFDPPFCFCRSCESVSFLLICHKMWNVPRKKEEIKSWEGYNSL